MLNLAGIFTHERFRKWRRVLIFVVFLIAGIANPSPDPITMLILGGACVALVEVAEFIIWRHDRRRARLHPGPVHRPGRRRAVPARRGRHGQPRQPPQLAPAPVTLARA